MRGRQSIIWLPGLCDDATMWATQVDGLADMADALPIDLVHEETVRDCAVSVLNRAPPGFALVGFSMGGYVALEIMRRAPERVSGLALISTSARADTSERIAARHAMIAEARAGRYAEMVARMLPQVVHPAGPNAEAVIREVASMAERIGMDAFCRQLRVCMSRPDSRPGLGSIGCPVLVICGREDRVTPPELSRELAEGMPGAELRIVEGAGHYVSMEAPEAVTEALRQWRRRIETKAVRHET